MISWPYRASHLFIAGPGIGPAFITSLVKIVLTLLRSFEHPGHIFIGGPAIGPAFITSLVKIVLILLRSFEHSGHIFIGGLGIRPACITSFQINKYLYSYYLITAAPTCLWH